MDKATQPVEVQLQITTSADMTLPEMLKLVAEQRGEIRDIAKFDED